MLTNHDMDRTSPFASLLIGQPTLRRRIKLGVLAALDQRIAVRYHMTGMSLEETVAYAWQHRGVVYHITIHGHANEPRVALMMAALIERETSR